MNITTCNSLRVSIVTCVAFMAITAFSPAAETVKVFILAGQSNMEGKAKNSLLEHQANDAKTREIFSHLRKDNAWITRDDAFIRFLGRHGGLTLGYGSRDRTGVELEFGWKVADHFEEPVLLIKAAWGGHSLFKLFRSPSAGMPSAEKMQEELEKARKNVTKKNEKNKRNDPLPTMDDIKTVYGSSYRNMFKEIEDTFANYETMFPQLKGRKLEIAGFVWFQGWNDMYGGAELEYASNMKHFINDVRKDLQAPEMPFVIGVMGQNGSKPAKGAMLAIQQAQLSIEKSPQFKENVKAVRTDELVDKSAEELYPKWRDNIEEWQKRGSDFAYHYMGSAIWHVRMGAAFGDAMLRMMKD
ncbi:MAG: sialate O-acetylesterase [Verrucomicrobiales bacterium]